VRHQPGSCCELGKPDYPKHSWPGVLPVVTSRRVCLLQGSFVTFEHNSNRVNIFYNPATNLVTRVPKRG
jgi:Potato inhibitor I family